MEAKTYLLRKQQGVKQTPPPPDPPWLKALKAHGKILGEALLDLEKSRTKQDKKLLDFLDKNTDNI